MPGVPRREGCIRIGRNGQMPRLRHGGSGDRRRNDIRKIYGAAALQARINRQRFAGIYCKNCGQRIPEGSEGFCCQECREKWEQQEKDSEERGIFLQPTKPEEKKPRFCRNCGKPVTEKNNTATADVDTSAIRHTSCCFKGNTGKEKRRKRRVNEAGKPLTRADLGGLKT